MKNRLLIALVIATLSQATLAADSSAEEKFQQALTHFNAADYPTALAGFDTLNQQLKANGDFNFFYALSLLKTGQSEKALAVMKHAIDLKPDNADFRYALGLIYTARMAEANLLSAAMMIGPARKTFQKAVELNPNHVGANTALAEFMLEVPGAMGGGEENAQEFINKLRTLDPPTAAALEAKLTLQKGNAERAEQLLLQAVATPDSAAFIRLRLAKFYADKKEYAQAIKFGEEYLGLPKRWSDSSRDTNYAHLWLAIAYHGLGDTAKFQQHAQAVEAGNMPKRVKEEIAKSYEKAGIKQR